MNTPRTKAPKRYQATTGPSRPNLVPGIQNHHFCSYVGTIITGMPFIEEQMLSLFSELTGISDLGSARLVFRSIINQKTRIDIMRALLEKAPQHKDKTAHFDELLDEFSAINNIRNKYAHGLWFTSPDGKSFYLQKSVDTYDAFDDPTSIPREEVHAVAVRMVKFMKALQARARQLAVAQVLSESEPRVRRQSGKRRGERRISPPRV